MPGTIRFCVKRLIAIGFLATAAITVSACAQGPSEDEKIAAQVSTYLASVNEALEKGNPDLADHYLFKLTIPPYDSRVDQNTLAELSANALYLQIRNDLDSECVDKYCEERIDANISRTVYFIQDNPKHTDRFKGKIPELRGKILKKYMHDGEEAALSMDEKGIFAALVKAQKYQKAFATDPTFDINKEAKRIYGMFLKRRNSLSQGIVPDVPEF